MYSRRRPGNRYRYCRYDKRCTGRTPESEGLTPQILWILPVIRDMEDVVEKIGVDRAKEYADKADLILYVIDVSRPLMKMMQRSRI